MTAWAGSGRKAHRRRNNRRDTGKPPSSLRCRAHTGHGCQASGPGTGTRAAGVFHGLRALSISIPVFGVPRGPPMHATGRFFLCARCRAQVFICRRCDRGQIYCASGCAQAARRASLREAAQRYQRSRHGRLAHAQRARRYRARHNKVTHHGSPAPLSDALLPADSTRAAITGSRARASVPSVAHCHVCGCACSPFMRLGPLRRRGPRSVDQHRGGSEGDDCS